MPLREVTVPAVSIGRVIPVAAACLLARVRRGLAGLVAAGLAAALLLAAAPTPAGAATESSKGARPTRQQQSDTPLAVSIDTLTPATLPRRGRVTVTGEVTNRSDGPWTNINAYLFVSDTPMRSSAEVAAATDSDPAQVVGNRLAAPGEYVDVGDLQPGESTDYRISVPRRSLPRGSGVFWIGVHVLGTSEQGRLAGADGRARTFISSLPAAETSTLSMTLPFRAEVRRNTEGRVSNLRAWRRLLADEGRLTRLLRLAERASDVPLALVVDPAVLSAVRSLSRGNPEFDLSPTDTGGPSPSPSPDPELTEEPGPVQEGEEEGAPEDVTEISPLADRATEWLERFTELAHDETVLTLPFGDLDLAALLRRDHERVYERAARLSRLTMTELGIEAEPVIAPPEGLLPQVALSDLDPDATLLLSERAVDTDATTVALGGQREAVVTSDAGRQGGPGPTPRFAALAMRQRVLAEAAVHALENEQDDPLVVAMPALWDPGEDWTDANFFGGLAAPWVRTVDLSFTLAASESVDYDTRLRYPRAQRQAELPPGNTEATRRLARTGTVLAQLLTRNDTIDEQAARAATLASSIHARPHPRPLRRAAERTNDRLRGKVNSVAVESSELVTMSSQSGSFQVTVVNELEEPVTVGVETETDSDAIEVRSPDLVSIGSGQRASVRLSVTATGTGVHEVRVRPTTREGVPVGRASTVALRSSQVGFVIWVIMGVGAVVFVAAIAARVVRRVRRRRASAPGQEAG